MLRGAASRWTLGPYVKGGGPLFSGRSHSLRGISKWWRDFLDLLLEIYEYSVSKIEYFQYFSLHELTWNWNKSSLSFRSHYWYINLENTIFQLSITIKIVKKKFLIDAHVKTLVRIIWMSEFCLKLLNLLQGVKRLWFIAQMDPFHRLLSNHCIPGCFPVLSAVKSSVHIASAEAGKMIH